MGENDADLKLARRITGGDAAAFQQLFDDYFPRLYRLARARLGGSEDEAREVVQLSFCRIFERIGTYRGEASLYAWMCQICRNAVTDRLRLRRRREPPPAVEGPPDSTIHALIDTLEAPPSAAPENEAWRQQLIGLIQCTLDALPDAYADVLEWKYVDGLPVNEIAALLRVGPKAAESLLTRARAAFREGIANWCGAGDLPWTSES
jgi:RNA polymerase sigma-70 factor (ECF subfamily)